MSTGKSIRLACKDYGFECSFEIGGNDPKRVMAQFQKHSLQHHHIEYSEGAMLQLVIQKENRIL